MGWSLSISLLLFLALSCLCDLWSNGNWLWLWWTPQLSAQKCVPSGPLTSGAKVSLGLLCLFEQKLRPPGFVVFSRAPAFLSLNRIPKHHYLISLSVCHWRRPTQTRTFLHFHLLAEKKKRPWKLLRDISSWLIFIFLKARRHRASGAIYHRNPPLPTFSSALTDAGIVRRVSSVSLKSLTLSKPLEGARNNTYCFIPVQCCKHSTWWDEAKTAGTNSSIRKHTWLVIKRTN